MLCINVKKSIKAGMQVKLGGGYRLKWLDVRAATSRAPLVMFSWPAESSSIRDNSRIGAEISLGNDSFYR